jgi:hypothetical protein
MNKALDDCFSLSVPPFASVCRLNLINGDGYFGRQGCPCSTATVAALIAIETDGQSQSIIAGLWQFDIVFVDQTIGLDSCIWPAIALLEPINPVSAIFSGHDTEPVVSYLTASCIDDLEIEPY